MEYAVITERADDGSCTMTGRTVLAPLLIWGLLIGGCPQERMKPMAQEKREFFATKAEVPDLREDFLHSVAAERHMTYEEAAAADEAISTTRPPIQANDRAVIDAGQKIFGAACARCHGSDLRGWGEEGYSVDKVDLTRRDRAGGWGGSKWAKYYKTVAKGKKVWVETIVPVPIEPMPAFEKHLAREQIWQVVAYVRHVQMNEDLHW